MGDLSLIEEVSLIFITCNFSDEVFDSLKGCKIYYIVKVFFSTNDLFFDIFKAL